MAERYVVSASCPLCAKTVYADEGYYSNSGAHINCHNELQRAAEADLIQKQAERAAARKAEQLAEPPRLVQPTPVRNPKDLTYRWLTTSPNPKSSDRGYDAGQRGWRLHLVPVDLPEHDFYGKYKAPALCGRRPNHGWGMDMFIDTPCKRCEAVAERLGIDTPPYP